MHGLHDWAVSSEHLGFLFVLSSLQFFGSVLQIELAIRQLLGTRRPYIAYRIVSTRAFMFLDFVKFTLFGVPHSIPAQMG